MGEKLSERLREQFSHFTLNAKQFQDVIFLLNEVVALEAELEKANQLSIKLALQKGGMVDEARTLKAERDRFKQREIELSKGWKRLHSENEDLRSRLAEAEKELKIRRTEFSESEKMHKAKFIASPPHSLESQLQYFEMGRAVGVLNMIEWLEEALRGEAEG